MIIVICIFLAVITLAVFGQTFNFGFVNLDDNNYVYQNPVVQNGLTWAGFRWAFTYSGIGHWHPLTWLTHMLDCQMYGSNAGGHHATNVLFHAASVILLFLVLQRMTGFLWRSAFVAAIFAIHPLHVESVAWISERKDVLSGFFFMLVLWAYVHYAHAPRSMVWYGAVIVFFAMGLLSKDMLVTLPFVLLLLDYWPLKRFSDFNPETLLRLTVEKVPLFMLAMASSLVTVLSAEKLSASLEMPVVLRVENAVVCYIIYLWQMVYPSGLTCLYLNPTTLLPLWQVFGALGLLLGITGVALFLRKTYPWLVVGWLWYLGMLVPVIGIVQMAFCAHADRYTYLSEIGIYIAITWMTAELAAKWQFRRAIMGSLMTGVIAVLMFCAWKQTAYWLNGETLWRHALAVTPNNSYAHANLADALTQNGQVGEAIVEYHKALAINPNYTKAWNNLGETLDQQGHVDEAIIQFQNALTVDPDYVRALNNLGYALAQKGRVDEAIVQFQKALALDPKFDQALNNLGNALEKKGQVDEAIAQYRKALVIDSRDAEVYYNLGNALEKKGQVDEAIAQYKKALTIKSNFAEANYGLGNALAKKGQLDEAVMAYQSALAINPNDAQACYNLGVTFVQNGQVDEAITQFQKALAINPNLVQANFNLGDALAEKGRMDEAIIQFQKTLALQPDFVAAQNNLAHIAWLMATSPDSSRRNGAKAIELARQTDRLTGGSNPEMAATLAAAYAEAGKFTEAITNVQRALQLASGQTNGVMVAATRAQLRCYQAGIAFRDFGTNP
ncbi:MAG TPA: tetratricopeptide repeat protein [Verrucomicrobiae bacterium]